MRDFTQEEIYSVAEDLYALPFEGTGDLKRTGDLATIQMWKRAALEFLKQETRRLDIETEAADLRRQVERQAASIAELTQQRDAARATAAELMDELGERTSPRISRTILVHHPITEYSWRPHTFIGNAWYCWVRHPTDPAKIMLATLQHRMVPNSMWWLEIDDFEACGWTFMRDSADAQAHAASRLMVLGCVLDPEFDNERSVQ